MIQRALAVRKARQTIFQNGDYLPMQAQGKWRNHVVAFARRDENVWAITVTPRFLTEFVKESEYPVGERVWKDTHLVLPEESPTLWKNAITAQALSGEKRLRMCEILQHFPVALLLGEKNA